MLESMAEESWGRCSQQAGSRTSHVCVQQWDTCPGAQQSVSRTKAVGWVQVPLISTSRMSKKGQHLPSGCIAFPCVHSGLLNETVMPQSSLSCPSFSWQVEPERGLFSR